MRIRGSDAFPLVSPSRRNAMTERRDLQQAEIEEIGARPTDHELIDEVEPPLTSSPAAAATRTLAPS
jgi:hypothetical protein